MWHHTCWPFDSSLIALPQLIVIWQTLSQASVTWPTFVPLKNLLSVFSICHSWQWVSQVTAAQIHTFSIQVPSAVVDEWWTTMWMKFISSEAEWKASPRPIQEFQAYFESRFLAEWKGWHTTIPKLTNSSGTHLEPAFLLLNMLDIFSFHSLPTIVLRIILGLWSFGLNRLLSCSTCRVANLQHISWNHFPALAWIQIVRCCFSHNASHLYAIHVGHWQGANHTMFPWQRWLAGPVPTAPRYVSLMKCVKWHVCLHVSISGRVGSVCMPEDERRADFTPVMVLSEFIG